MPTHVHLFSPGAAFTSLASAPIIGGRLVAASGDRQVAQATTGSVSVLGAAATDADTGDNVLVLRGGVQQLAASGPVTAGDRVVASTDGTVAAAAAGVRGIGIALTSSGAGGVQIALS